MDTINLDIRRTGSGPTERWFLDATGNTIFNACSQSNINGNYAIIFDIDNLCYKYNTMGGGIENWKICINDPPVAGPDDVPISTTNTTCYCITNSSGMGDLK